jgi:hypothetical protein
LKRRAIHTTITDVVLAVAMLLVCLILPFTNSTAQVGKDTEQILSDTLGDDVKPVNLDNATISTITPSPVSNSSSNSIVNSSSNSSNISNPPEAKNSEIKSSDVNYNSSPIKQPTVKSNEILNETSLLKSIKEIETSGGQLVLNNNLIIEDQDVVIPSNVAITGANPGITIFLDGKTIQVAANATNVTLKDLTIDFHSLEGRDSMAYGDNTTNVQLKTIDFYNYPGPGCLLVMGNQVELRNLSFTNVTDRFPIQIFGSNVSVSNCSSNDNSQWALVAVGGGNSNISITNNSGINRPLLNANYATLPTTNLSIENNVDYFPNGTYGLLVMGGLGDSIQAPYDNITVRGNFVTAGPGAWNAIAIYGLTSNALVVNNTVDMSLSGHNGIGISSGVNVTVVGNVVFGCTELTEGGIEVESNPVHNRFLGFSENVTVTGNTVYNCDWGIYVRVMCPDHPNWKGTILLSKDIVIENNSVSSCHVGVNLLFGINLIVRNNDIASNTVAFAVDVANVSNYTVTGNLGYP